MSEQDTAPNVQITPVGFSPIQSDDAIGTVMPASRPEMQFSVFWPLLIVLLTMIFGTTRDMMALNQRMSAINEENAPALELLKKAKKQSDFVDSIHVGLQKLAPTDPIAAQICTDFFPAQPDQKSGGQDNEAKTPAK